MSLWSSCKRYVQISNDDFEVFFLIKWEIKNEFVIIYVLQVGNTPLLIYKIQLLLQAVTKNRIINVSQIKTWIIYSFSWPKSIFLYNSFKNIKVIKILKIFREYFFLKISRLMSQYNFLSKLNQLRLKTKLAHKWLKKPYFLSTRVPWHPIKAYEI